VQLFSPEHVIQSKNTPHSEQAPFLLKKVFWQVHFPLSGV